MVENSRRRPDRNRRDRETLARRRAAPNVILTPAFLSLRVTQALCSLLALGLISAGRKGARRGLAPYDVMPASPAYFASGLRHIIEDTSRAHMGCSCPLPIPHGHPSHTSGCTDHVPRRSSFLPRSMSRRPDSVMVPENDRIPLFDGEKPQKTPVQVPQRSKRDPASS
jgi:hypothetical protein